MPNQPISILITGGASGIGAALATSLATNPQPNTTPYITIVDVNAKDGVIIASRLTTNISKAQFVQADISDFAALKAAFIAAVHFCPSHTLDHVIANAGKHDNNTESRLIKATTAVPAPSFETLSNDGFQPPIPPTESLNTLLTGQYFTAWLAAYYFRLPSSWPSQSFYKSLTVTVSAAAYMDIPSVRSPYWMAKWGLRGLFHSIKQDMHLVGARMNLVCPYWVKTGLTADLAANPVTSTAIPGGWVDVQDVAAAMRRCIEDVSISQRSFGVFPKPLGVMDMQDDIEGLWGGIVTKKIADAVLGGAEAREAARKASARE